MKPPRYECAEGGEDSARLDCEKKKRQKRKTGRKKLFDQFSFSRNYIGVKLAREKERESERGKEKNFIGKFRGVSEI